MYSVSPFFSASIDPNVNLAYLPSACFRSCYIVLKPIRGQFGRCVFPLYKRQPPVLRLSLAPAGSRSECVEFLFSVRFLLILASVDPNGTLLTLQSRIFGADSPEADSGPISPFVSAPGAK